MWTQIVGKVRLACAPMLNHWWQVPLYVTARGLTTSPIPYQSRSFEIDFDFFAHRLRIQTSDGAVDEVPFAPRSVADFYGECMATLARLDLEVRIWKMPQELASPIPFDEDHVHHAYDPERVERFARILVQADRLMSEFRSRFIGKCSPVHFFWGAFDMAVTRFSGRRAPAHPGGVPGMADWVAREGYSHEVSSCGFWPGSASFPQPAFYAYAYPEPAGFSDFPVAPAGAYYHPDLREFLLPYAAVRESSDPDRTLLDFFQSTYDAAADLGGWDRPNLERRPA